MDDDFHHGSMKLVAVAYWRGATFDIANVAAFIRYQNGAFELPGFFGIDAKIGRQLHRATHPFRDVDKRTVRGDSRIQRRKEIVVGGHDGTQVFFHQFRMVVNGLAKRAKNNPLFGKFFPVGGGHRYGVKNGVDRHFTPFTDRHTKLIECRFHFISQKRIRASLLYRPRLRGTSIITASAGWRGVIAIVLIIEFRIMGFQPVRLFHLKPGAKRAQAKFQHPFRLVTFSGNRPHDILINAFRQFVSG